MHLRPRASYGGRYCTSLVEATVEGVSIAEKQVSLGMSMADGEKV